MIMRKTSLILLGAAAGIAVTLVATQPRIPVSYTHLTLPTKRIV